MVEQTGNPSILELQQFLNRLKIRDNSGQKLEENGLESLALETATQMFQSIIGIYTDGSAGPVTWSAINRIFEQPILRADHAGGPIVRYVQYLVGIEVDGVYGSETASAVEKFQQKHGLTVDGIVGPQTWEKLTGLYTENLNVGSSGLSVEKLQQKLQDLDLYHGPIDGLFGQGVEQAVKEFQDSQGFAPDGVAGPSTLIALGLLTVEPESSE